MTFASATRLFAGTTTGEIYRIDQQPATSQWNVTRIDHSAAPLPLRALIANIAIDWADHTLNSIYIALAGVGDFRHVWHFNGSRWCERSDAFDTSLLDVEHNALVVV